MPLYTFTDTNTGETWEQAMKIADREIFLEENPHIVQEIVKAPGFSDPISLGRTKPDSQFREKLSTIKSFYKGSSVNDF